MAAASETYPKPSSPLPIPPPVCTPPRFDDDGDSKLVYNTAAALPDPHTSFRFQRVPPSPIPDFVFPAQPSASAPPPYSRTSGRRPKSVADLYDDRGSFSYGGIGNAPSRISRSPALPDFSFNPGASLPPAPGHAFLSPPQSPQSPRIIPARPGGGGHRRGGSEFVGGSLRHGEAFTLMSTSPTKSESGLSSPQLLPSATSASSSGAHPPVSFHGRRGHAHRRSAAISSHDISDILQPSSPTPATYGGPVSNSPSNFVHKAQKPTEEDKEYTSSERNAVDSANGLAIIEVDMPEVMKQVMSSEKVTELEGAVPNQEPTIDQQHVSSTQKVPTQRTRVGFSDTLEFIPRPLSLVSSDTSSTITARPTTGNGNHSLSGSISSITSLNASVALDLERDGISSSTCSPSRGAANESRPSTAGAILDRAQSITAEDINGLSPRRRNSIPFLAACPMDNVRSEDAAHALPSSNKTSKRWSFFSLDPLIGGSNSNNLNWPARPCTSDSPFEDETPHKLADDAEFAASQQSLKQSSNGANDITMEDAVLDDDDIIPTTKTVTRKSSSNKKKKKARTWGILARKSKPRRKSRRAPTPPLPQTQSEGDIDESFDAHLTATGLFSNPLTGNELSTPSPAFASPNKLQLEQRDDLWIWQPAQSPSLSNHDDDASFAIIDMDAALGPFNTPLPRNAEWEAAQRAGGLSKRQLHSAAGMTRFSGPGMHYSHRRAESAPEMPPFNRAGVSRFNSSAAMDDVFEEDEEEDDGDEGSSKTRPVEGCSGKQQQVASKATSLCSTWSTSSTPPREPAEFVNRPDEFGTRFPPSNDTQDRTTDQPMENLILSDAPSRPDSCRSGLSDLSGEDKPRPVLSVEAASSATSLSDDIIVEEDSDRFTFDDGYDFVMESSSDSTIHSPGRLTKGKELAPLDVSPLRLPNTSSPAPISPYTMAPSYVFPSAPSPSSYDANRISTAPSLISEDNFQSLLLGEPGPEVRVSSDIPSLTSSNSTMTRESAILQAPHYPNIGGQPRPYLPSRGNERPASFTSTAFGRRRSSLASLHRLISTSHGERSKLSIEVQMDSSGASSNHDGDKTAKSSKTKRISRMMQFWRGKDDATS
ncbi:hypothetical protein SEPCBS57363_002943 [Sporothrix epigloea]|uniref:Cell wall proline rich protein n=1 Tax=Sporothrix epigloea TaxID=1892477 RepID=A0ABP0DMX9_9PEZI